MLFLTLLLLAIPEGGDSPAASYEAALAHPGRTKADLLRDKTSKPAHVLAFAGVKPGMRVLDLYAGDGYYSEILNNVVGEEGAVVMHNNGAYVNFVQKTLRPRLENNRLKQVTHHRREYQNMELGENQFDVIMMVLAYHDFFYLADGWQEDPEVIFPQLHRALKPGGKLVVIDHKAKEGSGINDAQRLHRIDPLFAKADIQRRGFTFLKSADFLAGDADDKTLSVFDSKVRRKTDRFVYLFTK